MSGLTRSRADTISLMRVSAAARPRLGGASGLVGRIHSLFARCVNVEWSDGRLLALHAPGPLAAPFAASLARWPHLDGLAPGAPVFRRAGQLRLGGLVIETAAAATVSLAIASAPGSAEPLAAWLHGVEPDGSGAALRSRRGQTARAQLRAGIRRRDAVALLIGGRALVGLGEGLTPAGDDCLVGALAVLRRFAPGWLAGEPGLREDLARAAATGTTQVAREFILHALDGEFSEAVAAVVTAASPDEARGAAVRLLAIGATSGADTLDGMRVALDGLAPGHR